MSNPDFEILLVIGALATIVVAAAYVHGIARVFLVAQAAYWSLSYVARPMVLLWVRPQPRFGDSIADPRLVTIGYDHGIAMVLRPVAFGLWVYAIVVVAYAVWSRHRAGRDRAARNSVRSADDGNLIPTLWTIYAIGVLGRVVSYAAGSTASAGQTQSPNPLLSFVTLMAVIGALGLIVFYRPANRRVALAVIGALTVMELMWTVAIESKTPIMGAALAIAVRFALTGWSRVKVAAIAAISVLGIAAFGWLQAIKASALARAQSEMLDANYPVAMQPFLSILRRFDLLEAATDSYYLGGRPWLTLSDVAHHALISMVPEQLLGTAKFQSGTAWAIEVRGSSVDMTRVSVSLAEGNINEGFVVGGYPGVVLGVVFTFVLVLAGVRALHSRHIIPISMGLMLIEVPVFFERGILGSMELIGKSLQVAILVWIVYLLVGEYRRRTEASSKRKPQKPPHALVDAAGSKDWTGLPISPIARPAQSAITPPSTVGPPRTREAPVSFERGILGRIDLLGKSLQVAILVWIVYLLAGEYRRRTEASSKQNPQEPPHTLVDAAGSKG
ncbi:hypothetical protein RHA1_ro05736 [Rhodococcus jostii RHA1]|uniref:Oligosaccharide repeat unit polymerase n=1 Tax=Rhodococcus jostii (strain RHA1) TaxID=101510 RepID=Q0S4M2_RHOJR|nr:hypothetical protein [Rhodococcus jostii]ABG97514.1 hypothetical protein RHA1_ro05736 [Rhodococcus jostii RHA1]